MDNPEKLATEGNIRRRRNTTQYESDTTVRKQMQIELNNGRKRLHQSGIDPPNT